MRSGLDCSARCRGLDDGRDCPARRGTEPRAARCRDELHAAAQIGRDVESGRSHRCEPLCAQQGISVTDRAVGLPGHAGCADPACVVGQRDCSGLGRRFDDADVDIPGRRLPDGVAEFFAERGILLRNLCELHNGIFRKREN